MGSDAPTFLSLCSGVGGLDRALKIVWPASRTVAYVELDPFCQEILLRRADDGWVDRAPIWPDLRTFDGRLWRGLVDGVASGFPCQPFSHAGKRQGDADARNLWPNVRRIIAESEPAVVILENVPGALPYFYHVVLPELSGMGYAAEARLVTAAEVGASHRRQRIFVLAMADTSGERGRGSPSASADVGDSEPAGLQGRVILDDPGLGELSGQPPAWPPGPTERDQWAAILARWPDLAPAMEDPARSGERGSLGQGRRERRVSQASDDLADATDGGSRGAGGGEGARRPAEGDAPEPALRGVADGFPSRVDRLRALGNAVVPAQAARAILMLLDELR